MTTIEGGPARLASLARSSLVRNSAFIMVTTVATAAIGFFYWVIAARGYTDGDVGAATAVVSAFTLVSLIGNAGINALLIQRLPGLVEDREWSIFVTVGVLSTSVFTGALALAVGLVLAASSPHFGVLGRPPALLMLVAGAAASTCTLGLDAVCVASRRSEHMLTRNLVFSVVKVPLMIVPLLIVHRPGPLVLVGSWVAGSLVSIIVAVTVLVPRVRPGFGLAFGGGLVDLRRLWRSMVGHHLANMGSALPPYLLPVLVVARITTTANAYFYLTWSVGGTFLMISPAVAESLFAEGANAEDLVANSRRSAVFITALLAPVMVVCFVASHRILGVFGPAYAAHGSTLLRILVLSAVPDAVTNVYVSTLRVKHRLTEAATLNLAMAATALALTWWLLPRTGIVGAGVAWLIAQSGGTAYVAATVARARLGRAKQLEAADAADAVGP